MLCSTLDNSKLIGVYNKYNKQKYQEELMSDEMKQDLEEINSFTPSNQNILRVSVLPNLDQFKPDIEKLDSGKLNLEGFIRYVKYLIRFTFDISFHVLNYFDFLSKSPIHNEISQVSFRKIIFLPNITEELRHITNILDSTPYSFKYFDVLNIESLKIVIITIFYLIILLKNNALPNNQLVEEINVLVNKLLVYYNQIGQCTDSRLNIASQKLVISKLFYQWIKFLCLFTNVQD